MQFHLFILTVFWSFCSLGQSDFIHVDQFGYYTDATKIAVLSNPQIGFNASDSYTPPSTLDLIDESTGLAVYTGDVIVWKSGITDELSGDAGWRFDFSTFTTPGAYFILDATNNEQSAVFEINSIPYNAVLKTAVRSFYYNRCNSEKLAEHAGVNWMDGVSFLHPLQDANCRSINAPNDASLEKELSGGWFDTGDYNKSVNFAETPVHGLISAYTSNPSLFSDDWDIPESGNGVADVIDEIKWELDWLLKMSNPDGSVHIKLGSQNYGENLLSPPSANTDQRFYGPTCTSASATAAGIFAHASLLFDTIPGYQAYSNELATAAENCFNYVLPFFNTGTLELDCDDGSIIASDTDRDEEQQTNSMITASLYLYELTGTPSYHQFFIVNGLSCDPVFNDYWGPYNEFLYQGLLHYTTLSSANNSMKTEILSSFNTAITNNWNNYFGENDTTLYRDYIPDWSYHWGSTRLKCNYGMLNILGQRYGLNPNTYSAMRERAEGILQSFHGVNPLNLVYLSNMSDFGAEKSINEIFHRWFNDGTDYDNAQTSLYGPAPGYLVGGLNRNFTNVNFSPPYDQPEQKSYLDYNDGYPNNSWEVSEPAIYYQAPYVLLLSEIIGLHEGEYLNTPAIKNELKLSISPNPSKNAFTISFGTYTKSIEVEITNTSGKVILQRSVLSAKDVSLNHTLIPGIYFVVVSSENATYEPIRLIVK